MGKGKGNRSAPTGSSAKPLTDPALGAKLVRALDRFREDSPDAVSCRLEPGKYAWEPPPVPESVPPVAIAVTPTPSEPTLPSPADPTAATDGIVFEDESGAIALPPDPDEASGSSRTEQILPPTVLVQKTQQVVVQSGPAEDGEHAHDEAVFAAQIEHLVTDDQEPVERVWGPDPRPDLTEPVPAPAEEPYILQFVDDLTVLESDPPDVGLTDNTVRKLAHHRHLSTLITAIALNDPDAAFEHYADHTDGMHRLLQEIDARLSAPPATVTVVQEVRVEVPVEVRVEVPVEVPVERVVEREVVKIVEKTVEILVPAPAASPAVDIEGEIFAFVRRTVTRLDAEAMDLPQAFRVYADREIHVRGAYQRARHTLRRHAESLAPRASELRSQLDILRAKMERNGPDSPEADQLETLIAGLYNPPAQQAYNDAVKQFGEIQQTYTDLRGRVEAQLAQLRLVPDACALFGLSLPPELSRQAREAVQRLTEAVDRDCPPPPFHEHESFGGPNVQRLFDEMHGHMQKLDELRRAHAGGGRPVFRDTSDRATALARLMVIGYDVVVPDTARTVKGRKPLVIAKVLAYAELIDEEEIDQAAEAFEELQLLPPSGGENSYFTHSVHMAWRASSHDVYCPKPALRALAAQHRRTLFDPDRIDEKIRQGKQEKEEDDRQLRSSSSS